MKKLIMPAILFMGSIAFANAQLSTESQAPATEQATSEDGSKSAAVTELSETKEQTEVVLESKENKEEKCATPDKDGNEVKPEVVAE